MPIGGWAIIVHECPLFSVIITRRRLVCLLASLHFHVLIHVFARSPDSVKYRYTFFMRTGRISPVRCGLSVARYMYSQVGIITDYLGYDRDY